MIGLLGSIPFLVTVFQLPTSYILGNNGRRKKVNCWGAAIARFNWITILIVAGVGAALGPIAGGLAAKYLVNMELEFLDVKMVPLQVVFLISTSLRLVNFQLFRYVHEPEEASVGHFIRVLRNVRGLNVATGFNYLLHPFIEIMRKEEQSQMLTSGKSQMED